MNVYLKVALVVLAAYLIYRYMSYGYTDGKGNGICLGRNYWQIKRTQTLTPYQPLNIQNVFGQGIQSGEQQFSDNRASGQFWAGMPKLFTQGSCITAYHKKVDNVGTILITPDGYNITELV